VPSGYGTQCALWAPRLAGLGHDVAISAYFGLRGSMLQWQGIPVYPQGDAPYGGDVVGMHARHFGADLVLLLADLWCVPHETLTGLNVAAWMPIDCEPMGMMDAGRLKAYGDAIPVAMSRFGEKQLNDAGFDPVFYVPHGIDTTVFRPPEDRQGLREAMGVDDKFVIFMAAANMDKQRKAFPEQIAAFARLHARHPDTLLILHTMTQTSFGIDVQETVDRAGVADAVKFSSQYLLLAGMVDQDMLAASYGAADLVTNCSYGEGFGLPVVEAQACGTPVVVTDGSAMTETGAGGWKVRGEKFYIPQQHSWWVKPGIDAIYRAYEKAYQRGPAYQAKKAAAREHALAYDAERVLAEHWKPALEQILEAFRPVSKVVEFAGLKWQVDNPRQVFSDSLALSHESMIDPYVLGRIPDGGVFLDVGAHVGHYALRAAAKASQVIAIEANPDTAARLGHNLGLNGITNVTVHNVAAWDERTRMNLLSPHACERDGSTQVLAAAEGDDGFVDGVPLDELLAGLERLDLVKVDVEGADLHVLRGMAATLARLRPVLFIEDHSIYGYYERDELNALLGELGYRWHDPFHGYLTAEPVQQEDN
jgi:FkbM family methyltransferase